MVGGGFDIVSSRCGQMGGGVLGRADMRGDTDGNNYSARSSFRSGMMTLCTKALLSRFRWYACRSRTRLPRVSSVVLGKVIELLWKDSPDSVLLNRTAVRVNVSEAQRRPRHQGCEQSSNRLKLSGSVRNRLRKGGNA
jgi:hypothetical protein